MIWFMVRGRVRIRIRVRIRVRVRVRFSISNCRRSNCRRSKCRTIGPQFKKIMINRKDLFVELFIDQAGKSSRPTDFNCETFIIIRIIVCLDVIIK